MPFNFPQPIQRPQNVGLTYPTNLISNGRGYMTEINFIKYRPAYLASQALAGLNTFAPNIISGFGNGVSGAVSSTIEGLPSPNTDRVGSFEEVNNVFISGSTIKLPIPKKLNESNVLLWSEISLTSFVISAVENAVVFGTGSGATISRSTQLARASARGAFSIASIAGALTGFQINPFILQYFQKPAFREFNFTWTLAPRNRQESEIINNIVKVLKARSAPTREAGGFLMGYPDLAIIRFHPNDEFAFRMKECVIMGVHVDYTPAGPSFLESTSAPTMVNLTLHLKEAKLWWAEEWENDTIVDSSVLVTPSSTQEPPVGYQTGQIGTAFRTGQIAGLSSLAEPDSGVTN
jgi:hypothetical protein